LRRRATSGAPPSHGEAKSYVFGRYERAWHWTMALSGVALILTGLRVHGAAGRWPLALSTAVALHNAFAVVLMLNAFLALFYHLATAAIRNFIPRPQGLLSRVLEHLQYQARGIFYGEQHPRLGGQKLNPLQQLTYLALLNLLFPLQIATGVLIWAIGRWPAAGTALGGLTLLAPLHNLGAWLFLTFFVLHVYLVTTGRTPGEHLRSMITGYRDAEPADPKLQGA
jgi:thiosulfate reductase cytochrome b subunit